MNSKKDLCKGILVVSISLFFISCGVPMTKGEKWLSSKNENPEINISGMWVSPEWGVANFKQENKDVKGSLGDYAVKGTVSGTTIYLLMYHGEKADYSAVLKLSGNNTFKGVYCKNHIVDEVIDVRGYRMKPMSLGPLK